VTLGYRCDKCKRWFEGSAAVTLDKWIKTVGETLTDELCFECLRKYEEWIKS
jgi:hypothetical protein